LSAAVAINVRIGGPLASSSRAEPGAAWLLYGPRSLTKVAEAPAWLLDAIDPPRQPAPAPMAPRRNDGSGTRFALAALDAETRAILEAPDGAKHHAVNRAGFSITGLVAAGELPEAEARHALRSALAGIASRCRDFGAAEATLARAWQAGLAKPRQPSGSARP